MANITVLSNLLTDQFRTKIGSGGSPSVKADVAYGDEAYYMDPFTGEEITADTPSDLLIELDRRGIELPERNKIAGMQGINGFSFASDTEKNEFNAKINMPVYENAINTLIDKNLVEFNDPNFFKTFIKDSWDKKLDKDFFIKAEEKGLMSFNGEIEDDYKLEGVNKFYAVYSPLFDEIKKNDYVKAIRPRNTANIKYEWTQVGFDMSQYGSIENQLLAEKIIRNSLSKPDMTFQGEPVKGFRPILSYPIHVDQERAAHLQIWVHPTTLYIYEENGVKKTLVQPLTDINDSKGQAAILEAINRDLKAAGLKEVATIQSNRINKGVNPEHHNKAREIANTGKIEEVQNITPDQPSDMNVGQAADYYRKFEEDQTRLLADLFAQQEAALDKINAAKAARQALEVNARLENEKYKLNKEVENKDSIIAEKDSQITSLNENITSITETHAIEIDKYINKNNALQEQLQEKTEIADRVPALEKAAFYQTRAFDRLLKIAKAIRDTLRNEVKLLKDKLFNAETEISNLTENNKSLSDKFETANKENSTLKSEITSLSADNKSLSNKVEVSVRDNTSLKSELEALRLENSLLQERANKATHLELERDTLKEENKALMEQAKSAITLNAEVSKLKLANTNLALNSDTQKEIIKLYEDTLVEKNILKDEDRVIAKEIEEKKPEENKPNNKKPKM